MSSIGKRNRNTCLYDFEPHAQIRTAIVAAMLAIVPTKAYLCGITDKDFDPGVSG